MRRAAWIAGGVLVAIGIGLLVTVPRSRPAAVPAGDVLRTTRGRLVAAIEATPEPDPWLLAHALLALDGGDGGDGGLRDAWVERIASRWIVRGADGRASVPLHTEQGRGEQHPHLVLKCFGEVAAEHGHIRARELAHDLARAAIPSSTPPSDFRAWNDVAWLLHGVALLAREQGSPYRADTRLGEAAMTFGALALGALAELERADRIVEDALASAEGFTRPSGEEPPERAGIYAYTCGGQHLLQGVIAAAAAGWIPAAELPRVERRIEVLIRRLRAEEAFRRREEERALAAGVSPFRAARLRVRASLKLHGHALETLSLAHRGLPAPRPPLEGDVLREEIGIVERLLAERETVLDPDGTVAPRLQTEEPLAWELWFGDGAHALHGLARARAALGGP